MESREREDGDRHIVRETELAGEQEEELAHIPAGALLTPRKSVVVDFPEQVFVGNGPGHAGDGHGKKKQPGELIPDRRHQPRSGGPPCTRDFNLSGSTGLTQWSSNPDSSVRRRSASVPHPVRAMRRNCASSGSARMRRATSRPSMLGMPISSSTAVGANALIR